MSAPLDDVLDKDWKDFLSAFKTHGVEYMLVGGIDFDTSYPRRIIVPLGGVQVAVIGLNDLCTNKHAVGRLQDLADLEHLERAGHAPPGDCNAEDH